MFKHLSRGDPVPRSARFYNAIVDWLNTPGGDLDSPPHIPDLTYRRVRMRNVGTVAAPAFGPVVMVKPTYQLVGGNWSGRKIINRNEFLFAQTMGMDVRTVDLATWARDQQHRPLVALDNVSPGKLGWFAKNGLVPARIREYAGAQRFAIDYAAPSPNDPRLWEYVGGPAFANHATIQGYRIIWRSANIAQAGGWRWAIIDLDDRGPTRLNLFDVNGSGGSVYRTQVGNATSYTVQIGAPLNAPGQFVDPALNAATPGNDRRPYVFWDEARGRYTFSRDIATLWKITWTIIVGPNWRDGDTNTADFYAVISNDLQTWPNKLLARRVFGVKGYSFQPLSNRYFGSGEKLQTQLYLPAGLYFGNAATNAQARFYVRFFCTVSRNNNYQPGVQEFWMVTRMDARCDLLHENAAAKFGHLNTPSGGDPVP